MRELQIPTISRQRVRDLASWSGIEDAVDDDLLHVIAAPVVAAELRRIADDARSVRDADELLALLRARADELADDELDETVGYLVLRPPDPPPSSSGPPRRRAARPATPA